MRKILNWIEDLLNHGTFATDFASSLALAFVCAAAVYASAVVIRLLVN